MYDLHHRRITAWNQAILNPLVLQHYADTVSDKGAALNNCFGFVDGTVRPICRPGEHQRMVYNGHKRVHALKFQAVALPKIDSSSLVNFPYKLTSLSSEGKRHDAAMVADSNLLTALEQYVVSPTGQEMCMYGDPAYPLRVNLMAPFRGAALTAQMEAFNKSMSNVRTSVEWLFGDIVEYFKFMDFKKNLKIGLNSIGKLYVVCALLRNALTCLYGNSTSSYFKLDPPTLEEYFA